MTNDLPAEVHRAAGGRLACSYRAECLAIESGFRHLIPPRPETSQSPTRILVATDSLSAIEAFCCPLTMRDRVTEEIWIVLLPLMKRSNFVEFILSPSHCGILRSVTADADAVMPRSLPQDRVIAWHVGFLTAVRRRKLKDAQEEKEGAHTA
ncbi:hypothetical protein C3747_286g53 [Trypanosoma cruzi]|uniref:RNase H n=1 Tax=Trypanosoma cruzi TaxID=5693 RepID=A0A2V2VBL3_TRYCR|nr:hypothetical protein C3747_286g53 [Trypanosoma cruzi]